MGLDQYLYVDIVEWYMDNQPHPLDDEILGKVKEVRLRREFAYWRKSNQIHKWFVDNIQGGEDDCREYYAPVEKLSELLNIVNLVLEDRSKAPKLLPVQSGFFFGSTDYDESYFEDLEYTKERLDILFDEKNKEKFEKIDFTYTSSW